MMEVASCLKSNESSNLCVFLHFFNFVCSKNSHMLINITYGDMTLKMNYKCTDELSTNTQHIFAEQIFVYSVCSLCWFIVIDM